MKKHNLFVASILLSCFLSLSFSHINAMSLAMHQPQQNRNTISGHVFDSQRNPVGQVFVELQNEVYSSIGRTKTDGSGRYFFSGLSPGRFVVRVLPYGTNLEEQSQEVEIVNFVAPGSSTSENAQKDFYLKMRKGNVTAVTGTIFVQEVPENARKIYEKAVSDIDNKRVDVGIEKLRNAISLFPKYYYALERLGREYINQQKYDDALSVFTKAVAVNERGFYSWYGLSYANYALKKSTAAVEAAQKAVSLSPNSAEGLLFLGVAQRQAKQYVGAEKSLQQAKKLANGKLPDVHWNLALLYVYNLKRYKDAADELELYLKEQPVSSNEANIKKLIKRYREMAISN